MYFITIDCGTTNSRAYVVDETGNIYAKATKKVGVRNTSMTGSNQILKDGLREIISEAIKISGIKPSNIKAILSSGMITSEIGLCELPHIDAPATVDDLACNIKKVDILLTKEDIPVYFVRGIRNAIPKNIEDPFSFVGNCDFMRGEETQIAGILADNKVKLPATITFLSSHTKFIPVNKEGVVLGSLTTCSGQVREGIITQSFVGKSIEKHNGDEDEPINFFNNNIVKQATLWIEKTGLLRTVMSNRFLDVLLNTKWYERKLFFEAMIAAEDMLSVGQLSAFSETCQNRFVFIGLSERCRLYEYVIQQIRPDAEVISICDTDAVDHLSIDGILNIFKKAKVFK